MTFHWHALRPDDGPAMSTLTVLAPLTENADDAESRLARFDTGPSPFAASERTHFARLVVLPADLPVQARPQGMRRTAQLLDLFFHLGRPQVPAPLCAPYLLFTAAYDPEPGDDGTGYAEHLRERLGACADDIWSGCTGYPAGGWLDPAGFQAFVAAHRLHARYVFTPPEQATVAQVRGALELRRRTIDVARRAQHLDPAGLRATFRASFAAPAPPPDLRLVGGDSDETAAWNDHVRRDAEAFATSRPRRARPALTPADLDDVQGIAVGYRKHLAAACLLLRITDIAPARQWLASLPLTSAAQARAGEADIGPALHVAVTHAGLRALGVPAGELGGLDRSYRAGMALREHALAPGVGTSTWEQQFRDGETHLLVQVSALDRQALAAAVTDLREGLAASAGFAEPYVQCGERIASPDAGYDGFVEHFGFADGISQPQFEGLTRAPDTAAARAGGPALPPGELLLGYPDVDGDTAGGMGPEWLTRNGSYLVFRKLEQDVPAFRAMTRGLAGASEEPADLAARLVGRDRDGRPLRPAAGPAPVHTMADPGTDPGAGADRPGTSLDDDLSFAADPDGFGCPVGSHVRRVNPRDSMPLAVTAPGAGAAPDPDKIEPRLVRRHRMLRRGIPYGPVLPPGEQEQEPPEGGRGLLFVALVGDIGRQYEFVQTQWMNDGSSLRLGSDPDVFAGVAGPDRKVTLPGDPPAFVSVPQPVVTCRGGEYFFLPGLVALTHLTQLP